MLRVTPLYGSRWEESGASRSGSCTLVEYADVKVLVDVGLRNSAKSAEGNSNNNIVSGAIDSNNKETGGSSSSSPYSFWENLPAHDCLVLTDSTLESMGSLPLYVEGIRRANKKKKNIGSSSLGGDVSRSKGSSSLRGNNINGRSGSKDDSSSSSGLVPPIFATFPTVKMGQMSLYDHHANISLDGGRPPYTLEEMDRAISMLRTIKYSQTLALPLANDGDSPPPRLSVTAHRAGHVVGGAFYRLERLRDETSVVVTGNAYHIAKELHLDACTLLKNGTGADVLVTRPGGPAFPLVNGLYTTSRNIISNNKRTNDKKKALMVSPLASRARRDLTERVLGFLRRDANVLLPVDASGRALELILLFNRFWSKQNLSGSYNLVWFGSMVNNTLEFSRSQLEWMNAELGNNVFDTRSKSGGGSSNNKSSSNNPIDHGQHPYLLRHVKLCTNMAELDKILAESNDNPTCVLANGLTLDHGPARDLFLRWADNDNNAVIFTDSSQCLERETTILSAAASNSALAVGKGGVVSSSMKDLADANGSETSVVAAPNQRTLAASITTPPLSSSAGAPTGTVKGGDSEADVGVDASIEDSMMGKAINEDEASPYTTSYQLLKHWSLAKAQDREMDDMVPVDVMIPRRTPLVGSELTAFLEKEEAARLAQRKREEEEAMLREVELAKGRLRLGDESGNPSSASGAGSGGGSSVVAAASSAPGNEAGASSSSTSKAAHLPFFRVKKKSRFDSSLFLKFSKPLHLTFELREDAVGVGQRDVTARFGIGESIENSEVLEDDYGIAVLPDQFRDIVTGVDPSKFGSQKDEINKRGLGFAASGSGPSGTNKDDGGSGSGALKKRRRKDDLGLGLRVGDNDNSGNGNAADDDDSDERGMEAIDLSEGFGIIRGRNGRPPTKVGTVHRRIEVVAEIDYIPFEGRVDSRSARQSVRALQPRHVVVLGGTNPSDNENGVDAMDLETTKTEKDSPAPVSLGSVLLVDEVRALAEAARGFVVSKKDPVLTPSDATTVELRVGHNAYPARLVATPFRTKEERRAEEVVPDPIELTETNIGSCTVSMLDFVMTGQKVALDGSIVIAPKNDHHQHNNNNNSAASSSVFELERKRPPVYVSDGEVLLTDLRTELIAQHGMKAEYSAHAGYSQLVVNGRIVVKKWSDGRNTNTSADTERIAGKIDVEGPLCEDFFTVRSVVCNQYVTL